MSIVCVFKKNKTQIKLLLITLLIWSKQKIYKAKKKLFFKSYKHFIS